MMMQEINIFEELFLSTEMWGIFGPLALVVLGFLITKKARELSIFFIIVDSLIIWQYLNMANYEVYMWHAIILLLGVIQCAFRLASR